MYSMYVCMYVCSILVCIIVAITKSAAAVIKLQTCDCIGAHNGEHAAIEAVLLLWHAILAVEDSPGRAVQIHLLLLSGFVFQPLSSNGKYLDRMYVCMHTCMCIDCYCSY